MEPEQSVMEPVLIRLWGMEKMKQVQDVLNLNNGKISIQTSKYYMSVELKKWGGITHWNFISTLSEEEKRFSKFLISNGSNSTSNSDSNSADESDEPKSKNKFKKSSFDVTPDFLLSFEFPQAFIDNLNTKYETLKFQNQSLFSKVRSAITNSVVPNYPPENYQFECELLSVLGLLDISNSTSPLSEIMKILWNKKFDLLQNNPPKELLTLNDKAQKLCQTSSEKIILDNVLLVISLRSARKLSRRRSSNTRNRNSPPKDKSKNQIISEKEDQKASKKRNRDEVLSEDSFGDFTPNYSNPKKIAKVHSNN